MASKVEYIWIDGTVPTPKLRSKTKVVSFETPPKSPESFPDWSFDGSSTNQASGDKSDIILKPIFFCHDPIRKVGQNYLVMCETFNADGTPTKTNHRAELRRTYEKFSHLKMWLGFEQEYVFLQNGRPLGWPAGGYPPPQGPFYCGVGADEVVGREIVEEHLDACLAAGIGITGVNAEVVLSQWEFQIFSDDVLKAVDMVWVARWLLYRIAENHGVSATLDPKPVKGWNGSGMHTNFSTADMRADGGIKHIENACIALGRETERHLQVYGVGNEKRLTGGFETCDINEFRYGVGDRGASVRIPLPVGLDGKGYAEDRRPASNACPIQVANVLLKTIGEDIKRRNAPVVYTRDENERDYVWHSF